MKVVFCLLLLCLTACGQKGPLYLSEPVEETINEAQVVGNNLSEL